MTPERWKQIQENLDVAAALAATERESFLNQLGNADRELQQEVESLLSYQTKDPGFLQTAALESLAHGQWRQPKRISLLSRVFGPYQLTELLGVGGMGDVYRAVRVDGQYEQQVALKIVRSDFTGELTTHFRNERQILATLVHPNIARILDGSTTEDGVPYVVMELIEGLPITQYCDQNHLPTDDRLKLFRTVCSAVHYAHQHLVVHRDIKPSNILVTADGMLKLLDFGIAKILDPNSASENATRTGMLIMTPEYASPEQLRGEPITTATDVYSLGMVLYVLLTGCHPFHARGNMPHEVARGVLEMEPERPSAVLRRKETDAQSGGGKCAALLVESNARNASPENQSSNLSGDLDSIVLKALRKEPRDRYSSADQLSEDIRRHLEGLPVLARKGTLSYRASKYVLRHKVAVGSAALVLLTLVAGIVLTLHEARIAERNGLRAERRFSDVRKLANSLLFEIHDSIKDLPGSTQARKLIVQNALQYLDSLSSEAAGDPSLQRELATAYERVGEVQGHYLISNLGETENALHSYQKALTIRKILSASKNANVQDRVALARCQRLVASQLAATGEIQSAFQNIQAAITLGESLRTKRPQDTNVLSELSLSYEIRGQIQRGNWATLTGLGDQVAALDSYRKAVEIDKALVQFDSSQGSFQRALWHDEVDYADMIRILDGAKWPQALKVYKQALQVTKKINEETPSIQRGRDLATVYNRIGMAYDAQGDHIRSFESHHEATKIYEDLLSKDPSNAMISQGLAIAYANAGEEVGAGLHRKTESEAYLDKSVELMRALVKSSPQNASQVGFLAQMFVSRARNFLYWKSLKAARRDYESAVQLYRELAAKDTTNMGARSRVFIYSVAAASIEMQLRNPQAPAELRSAINDAAPALTGNKADDEVFYAAATAYAELGDIETATTLHAGGSKKDHWQSAAHWYELSLKASANIRDPADKTNSNYFAPFDTAAISKRLSTCESALSKMAQ